MFTTRNVNLLSAEDLASLPGISADLADAILERRAVRPIADLEELLELPGVTDALLMQWRQAGLRGAVPLEPKKLAPGDLRIPNLYLAPPYLRGPGLAGLRPTLLAPEIVRPQPVLRREGDEEEDGAGPAPEPGEDASITVPDTRLMITVSRFAEDEAGNRITILELVPAYCLVAWILLGGPGPGDGSGASSLGRGATGAGKLKNPTQQAVNDVAALVRDANRILGNQCNVQFRLCRVYVFDTRLAASPDGQGTVSTALFDGPNGEFFGEKNTPQGKVSKIDTLFNVMFLEFPREFDLRCAHLFFVSDVQRSAQAPDSAARTVRGVGGVGSTDGNERNKPYVPMAVAEGNSGATVAHELCHGMDLGHAETSTDPVVTADPANLMREIPTGERLQASQCRQVQLFVANYLRPGC